MGEVATKVSGCSAEERLRVARKGENASYGSRLVKEGIFWVESC